MSNSINSLNSLNQTAEVILGISATFQAPLQQHIDTMKSHANTWLKTIEPAMESTARNMVTFADNWKSTETQLVALAPQIATDSATFKTQIAPTAKSINDISTQVRTVNNQLVALQRNFCADASAINTDLNNLANQLNGDEAQIASMKVQIANLQSKIHDAENPPWYQYLNPVNWINGMYAEAHKLQAQMAQLQQQDSSVAADENRIRAVINTLNQFQSMLNTAIGYTTSLTRGWQNVEADLNKVNKLVDAPTPANGIVLQIELNTLTKDSDSTKSVIVNLMGIN